jgi:hypothetical protein
MPDLDSRLVLKSVHTLLEELYIDPNPEGSWILNRDDVGLLDLIDEFSAGQASAHPIPGRSSLAGHVNHLRFSLELLNRWSKGEEAFADADWKGSWSFQTVTESEWQQLRDALRDEAQAWMEAIQVPRTWDEMALTGAIASAAHAAYHVGAIRQLVGLVEVNA